MKRTRDAVYGLVRISRFPVSQFFLFFAGLLLASGVHMGLITLTRRLTENGWVLTAVPIVYWGAVSLGMAVLTRHLMRNTFEKPVQALAAATRKVAEGDFSIYVPPFHTEDRYDYLDVMILDFNKMVAELGSMETMKTDFFSNVSHEIKTPLAVIQNTAQLLYKNLMQYLDSKNHATNWSMPSTVEAVTVNGTRQLVIKDSKWALGVTSSSALSSSSSSSVSSSSHSKSESSASDSSSESRPSSSSSSAASSSSESSSSAASAASSAPAASSSASQQQQPAQQPAATGQ